MYDEWQTRSTRSNVCIRMYLKWIAFVVSIILFYQKKKKREKISSCVKKWRPHNKVNWKTGANVKTKFPRHREMIERKLNESRKPNKNHLKSCRDFDSIWVFWEPKPKFNSFISSLFMLFILGTFTDSWNALFYVCENALSVLFTNGHRSRTEAMNETSENRNKTPKIIKSIWLIYLIVRSICYDKIICFVFTFFLI